MGYRYLTIGSNPSSFAITTNKKVNTQNGYYMTDSVFAYGDIPSYSLFSGIGNWNDTTLWSHLPPLRHRNALIKGNVSITTDTYCKDIAIHSGSLEINPGSLFILQNLDLYETKPLSIQEGQYFFPAVSPSIKLLKNPANGILSHFLSTFIRLASTSTSNKRMLRLTTEATIFMSNPTTETSGHRPTNLPGIGKSCPSVPIMSPCSKKQRLPDRIRRENDKPNFIFSSRPGDIPENFANIGAIAIPLNSDSSSGNQENHGWYLCGNPFPALLPLTQIEKTRLWMEISMYMTETVIKPIPLIATMPSLLSPPSL